MTIQELITKALQELKVVVGGEVANATDSADALVVLNSMMAQEELMDIDFNWFPQDTLSDTLPIPRWAENYLISKLAIELSAQFQAPISNELLNKAQTTQEAVETIILNRDLKELDMTNIPLGTSRSNSILTDS